MAVETLVNITQDEIEYARLCNQIKSQLDYQSGMVNAKREGLTEGREERDMEIIRNALAKGFPIETVQELTGIDIKFIQDIQAERI